MFNIISTQPELVAKCIQSPESTIKSALSLSATSHHFYKIVNSFDFFRFFSDQKILGTSFKERYFHLRTCFSSKSETFQGAKFGDAIAHDNDVEVFSFNEMIYKFKLKEQTISQTLAIPKDLQINPNQNPRISPFVASSKEYLAINDRHHSCIYVYTPDGTKCLERYDVQNIEGEISQVTILDDLLCVVVGELCSYQIVVFDLKKKNETYSLVIPGACTLPIYFGKEYLIYVQPSFEDRESISLPIACLSTNIDPLPWLKVSENTGFVKYFPYQEDFIEMSLDEGQISLSLLSISNKEVSKKTISNGIHKDFSNDKLFSNTCLHDNRLFIAYENPNKEIEIYSYDLFLKKMTQALIIPPLGTKLPFFQPRFLCTAENIHYLSMVIGTEERSAESKSYLSTLTYAKI